MSKIKRSEYVIVSRTICRTLFSAGCFGKGSLYLDNLVKGLGDREFSSLNITKDKIKIILDALVKQRIICRLKKKHGWKYYLNRDRMDKIREITRETGKSSIIPLLLLL